MNRIDNITQQDLDALEFLLDQAQEQYLEEQNEWRVMVDSMDDELQEVRIHINEFRQKVEMG